MGQEPTFAQVREEYLANLREVKLRSEFRLDHNAAPDAQIEAIREEAKRIYQLQQRNNEILRSCFYEKDPEELSDEQAAEWFDFARALVDDYRRLDLPLAYQLHAMLLRRARAKGDRACIIRERYYCGLTLHYIDLPLNNSSANLYNKQVRDYFAEAADFLPQFAELDHESRAYVIRSLGNIDLGYSHSTERSDTLTMYPPGGTYQDILDCFDRAYAAMTDPNLRAIDPDLPWEDYVYAMHFGRTILLSHIREGMGGQQLRDAVYESACYVYERQSRAAKRKNLGLSARVVYVHAAASYHVGRMDIDELMELMLRENARADNSINADNIFRHLSLVPYLQCYLHFCTPEQQAKFMPRVKAAIESGYDYVRKLPISDYFSQASMYVRNTIVEALADDKEMTVKRKSAFLRMFLTCHRPTYVHSLMVAWLTGELVKRLLDTDPDLLLRRDAGAWRCATREEAAARRQDFVRQAYEVGLYHDVGKTAVLEVVSNYGRRLTKEEFQVIQRHPYIGYWLLKTLGGMDQCAESALGHHCFFNESSGYPLDIAARRANRCNLLTDVLSVADSLDAATDDIGRSYAVAKNFTSLVAEFLDGADTRYSGRVVAIFEDEDFVKDLERRTMEKRRATYLRTYRDSIENAGRLEL